MGTISSAQSFNFSTVNYWVSLLSMFSTILLGVFGALGLILGFLVWRQNEMRKDAEEEMSKIKEISKKTNLLFQSYSNFIAEAKAMMITAKGIMEGTLKKTKDIDELYLEMTKKGKEVEEITNKIDSIRVGLRKDYESLATVSRMMPNQPKEPDFLVDYGTGTVVGEIKSAHEYSSSVIKKAIEMAEKMKVKEK